MVSRRRRPYHELPELLYKLLEEERERQEREDCPTCGMPRIPSRRRSSPSRRRLVTDLAPAKKTRRVSAYQKEFGRQLKALKKKHPRTAIGTLMKKAHAKTRRARK